MIISLVGTKLIGTNGNKECSLLEQLYYVQYSNLALHLNLDWNFYQY
jgi:hypothetical protein